MPEDHHHRTPMAWQHRNQINSNGYLSSAMESGRSSGSHIQSTQRGSSSKSAASHNGNGFSHPLAPPTPGSNRYGKAPNTPSSAHSRATLRNEGRRDYLESSHDRYSHDGRGSSKGTTSRHTHHHSSNYRHHRSGGGPAKGSYTRSHHSPSSTDETVEETTETESQMHDVARGSSEYGRHTIVHGLPPPYPPMAYQTPSIVAPANPFVGQQLMMAPNGSIRSVHSMPVLAPGGTGSQTWDGEPCPVHHSAGVAMPLAALYGMGQHHPRLGHSSVPPSVISGPTNTVRRARSIAEMSAISNRLDSKSFHGSMTLNPRIVLAENGTPSTLPVREATKLRNGTLPRSAVGAPVDKSAGTSSDINCCSGSFIVMWIILGIITFGILLGIVLKFTVT